MIPGSEIVSTLRPDPNGPALMLHFTLGGTHYQALNGGPQFQLNEAVSISVSTKDQAETDRLWDALLADGATHVGVASSSTSRMVLTALA